MPAPTFAEIEQEFNESLGYVRNDIIALCRQDEKVNYTVALLVGCGCEILANALGDRIQPHDVLAELLPTEDWKTLAKPLYKALRNGLAHKFDTKHLHIDGQIIQVYFSWSQAEIVLVRLGGQGLFIGTRPLGTVLCSKIEELHQKLKEDLAAREQFRRAYERETITKCSAIETAAWKRLANLP